MPKHLHESHLNSDHFDFSADVMSIKPFVHGGANLASTVLTNPVSANTDTLVQASWTGNSSPVDVVIDNASHALKYTGTPDLTLRVLVSMAASIDTNAVTAKYTVYVNGTPTSATMVRYFDKLNASGAFTLSGRIDVKKDELIQIYVQMDSLGPKITTEIANIDVFQI